MQSELHFRNWSCTATTGVAFAGLELAGNGLELDLEMIGNGWSPYNIGKLGWHWLGGVYKVKSDRQLMSKHSKGLGDRRMQRFGLY
jgi:hypothetical protein